MWVVHNNNMRWDHSLNGQSTYSLYTVCGVLGTLYRHVGAHEISSLIIILCRCAAWKLSLKNPQGSNSTPSHWYIAGMYAFINPPQSCDCVLFNWKPGWWVGKNKLGSPQLHSWNQSPGSAWSVQLSDSLENWGSCRWMILLNVCYPKADLRESARRSNLWMPVWRHWSGHYNVQFQVLPIRWRAPLVWEYRHCSHVTSPWTSVNSHCDFSFAASPWHPFMHSFNIPA